MAGYDKWNEAILSYITTGVQIGSRVFLSIDDEAIIEAGSFIDPHISVKKRVDDFRWAVRFHCIDKDKINLKPITPVDGLGETPPYLAFLAATVLAAYRMSEGEDVSSINYFTRLREVLFFEATDGGRPPGMESGSEERLWLHWSRWLARRGYLASAKPGVGSRNLYIGYPISQTLLRRTDKESLWRHFINNNWRRNRDQDAVSAEIIRSKQDLTSHLRTLLSEANTARRSGLLEAIYELYEAWTSSDSGSTYTATSISLDRNLTAGLYREVDWITNTITYFLFPRQARRTRVLQAQVHYRERSEDLIEERPGWYEPLWKVSPEELNQGIEMDITGTNTLQKLVLPARDFWILKPDPYDSELGDYASWGNLELGTPFIMLCKAELAPQLGVLKDEGLIQWRGDPVQVWEDADWIEYQDMMVLSQTWTGVSIDNQDLLNSLKAKSSLGVSFRGGLRVPRGQGWISGYGPEMHIHSFYREANLILTNLSTNEIICELEAIPTDEPVKIDWSLETGDYHLRVDSGDDSTERNIRVVAWGDRDLTLPAIDLPLTIEVGSGTVFGAFVEGETLSDLEA